MESSSSEANVSDLQRNVLKLSNSVAITRKELQNLRKDLRRLNHVYQKDMDNILTSLKDWKCTSCSSKNETCVKNEVSLDNDKIFFQPIGIISTSFHEKRGIPRQSSICGNSQGKLTLFSSVFTNPEHALENLEEFSHMWIMFYFHKNDSTHVRAKVSPPRLNGLKTGVFGTRSPHRPCPIGLSLVHIDCVDGSSVYFSGVDMLDGTPVFDIKPYIPQYDNPTNLSQQWNSKIRLSSSDDLDESVDQSCIPREAPDGEEDSSDTKQAAASALQLSDEVRVPRWITEPAVSQLTVTFSDKAKYDLSILMHDQKDSEDVDCKGDLKKMITRILQEDPRSVYVRQKYGNQFYTFLIGKFHVSCKFDDFNHTVQVYKIVEASSLSFSSEGSNLVE